MRRASVGLVLGIIGLVLAIVATSLAAVAVTKGNGAAAERRTVAVSGTGIAKVEPDLALFSVGVFEQGKSLAEVQGTVATKTDAILTALKNGGIDIAKDAKTTNYSVQPQFDYPKDKAPVLSGYRVQNTIAVTVRDIKSNKVGQLLDATVTAGANQIGSITFTVADPDKAYATARADAMKNAKGKADALVAAGGGKLGRVITVSDQTTSPGPPQETRYAAAPAAGAAAPPTQIQAGESSVTITVSVTYALD